MGIVNLGKILPISQPYQPALEPTTNNLEADKRPRQDLKWINLTVPSIGLMALNCAPPKSIMEADRKNVQARGLDLLVASPSQSS
jgi:hypothetical protein